MKDFYTDGFSDFVANSFFEFPWKQPEKWPIDTGVAAGIFESVPVRSKVKAAMCFDVLVSPFSDCESGMIARLGGKMTVARNPATPTEALRSIDESFKGHESGEEMVKDCLRGEPWASHRFR